MSRRIALVRKPSPRLAEGLVTHIERTPVDLELARRQHDAYVKALRDNGWTTIEVEPADDCPDCVFIEDAVLVFGDLAVVTRPGATQRQPEVAGALKAVQTLGLRVTTIEAPATLDGGDVLHVDNTVYVGLGGRTNQAGVDQLRDILAPYGKTVIAVPLGNVLHLKSAVTALPDGTFLMWSGVLDPAPLRGRVRIVVEEPGAHVVPLGGPDILIAASAPKTAATLTQLRFNPIVVDISEYEKLEGCVTCLSVLVQ
jgi:dimethylargininase